MRRSYWVRFKDLSAYVTESASVDEDWYIDNVDVFNGETQIDGDNAEQVYNEIMANKYSESFDEPNEPNYNEE